MFIYFDGRYLLVKVFCELVKHTVQYLVTLHIFVLNAGYYKLVERFLHLKHVCDSFTFGFSDGVCFVTCCGLSE